MPTNILLLPTTISSFMNAISRSASEGATQGGGAVTIKALGCLYAVDPQEEAREEFAIPEIARLEDLLEVDGILLLLRDAGDATRAIRFLKQAANLPEHRLFIGKLGSVFVVPGAASQGPGDWGKELAYEMMKLGMIVAELPYRFLIGNELDGADGKAAAGPSLVQLVAARMHARHIAALTRRIDPERCSQAELIG
ncbi:MULTISPECIES: hypothetical protein [unclassified Sinorhizobium]|uniref:hypothetical protein n=1 Tax=unclassified Sinorhizobium TaxID=2613772 RepID=UPI0024C2E12C|nr:MULTISPECIES: hypothetical protein [unclassified Sinorhizobium]MDK1374311.1 hypothetical protein [Sinorhizobium sp. 6-70]MDK1479455.1 hypothetical protein [Sinorhizobium sp. 6-117]